MSMEEIHSDLLEANSQLASGREAAQAGHEVAKKIAVSVGITLHQKLVRNADHLPWYPNVTTTPQDGIALLVTAGESYNDALGEMSETSEGTSSDLLDEATDRLAAIVGGIQDHPESALRQAQDIAVNLDRIKTLVNDLDSLVTHVGFVATSLDSRLRDADGSAGRAQESILSYQQQQGLE